MIRQKTTMNQSNQREKEMLKRNELKEEERKLKSDHLNRLVEIKESGSELVIPYQCDQLNDHQQLTSRVEHFEPGRSSNKFKLLSTSNNNNTNDHWDPDKSEIIKSIRSKETEKDHCDSLKNDDGDDDDDHNDDVDCYTVNGIRSGFWWNQNNCKAGSKISFDDSLSVVNLRGEERSSLTVKASLTTATATSKAITKNKELQKSACVEQQRPFGRQNSYSDSFSVNCEHCTSDNTNLGSPKVSFNLINRFNCDNSLKWNETEGPCCSEIIKQQQERSKFDENQLIKSCCRFGSNYGATFFFSNYVAKKRQLFSDQLEQSFELNKEKEGQVLVNTSSLSKDKEIDPSQCKPYKMVDGSVVNSIDGNGNSVNGCASVINPNQVNNHPIREVTMFLENINGRHYENIDVYHTNNHHANHIQANCKISKSMKSVSILSNKDHRPNSVNGYSLESDSSGVNSESNGSAVSPSSSSSSAANGDDPNSDELQYGPGIVDKLRSKFLQYSLKTSCTNNIYGSVVKRCSSLENLVDRESTASSSSSSPLYHTCKGSNHCVNLKRGSHFVKYNYHQQHAHSNQINQQQQSNHINGGVGVGGNAVSINGNCAVNSGSGAPSVSSLFIGNNKGLINGKLSSTTANGVSEKRLTEESRNGFLSASRTNGFTSTSSSSCSPGRSYRKYSEQQQQQSLIKSNNYNSNLNNHHTHHHHIYHNHRYNCDGLLKRAQSVETLLLESRNIKSTTSTPGESTIVTPSTVNSNNNSNLTISSKSGENCEPLPLPLPPHSTRRQSSNNNNNNTTSNTVSNSYSNKVNSVSQVCNHFVSTKKQQQQQDLYATVSNTKEMSSEDSVAVINGLDEANHGPRKIEIVKDELPKPDTVKKCKKIFESTSTGSTILPSSGPLSPSAINNESSGFTSNEKESEARNGSQAYRKGGLYGTTNGASAVRRKPPVLSSIEKKLITSTVNKVTTNNNINNNLNSNANSSSNANNVNNNTNRLINGSSPITTVNSSPTSPALPPKPPFLVTKKTPINGELNHVNVNNNNYVSVIKPVSKQSNESSNIIKNKINSEKLLTNGKEPVSSSLDKKSLPLGNMKPKFSKSETQTTTRSTKNISASLNSSSLMSNGLAKKQSIDVENVDGHVSDEPDCALASKPHEPPSNQTQPSKANLQSMVSVELTSDKDDKIDKLSVNNSDKRLAPSISLPTPITTSTSTPVTTNNKPIANIKPIQLDSSEDRWKPVKKSLMSQETLDKPSCNIGKGFPSKGVNTSNLIKDTSTENCHQSESREQVITEETIHDNKIISKLETHKNNINSNNSNSSNQSNYPNKPGEMANGSTGVTTPTAAAITPRIAKRTSPPSNKSANISSGSTMIFDFRGKNVKANVAVHSPPFSVVRPSSKSSSEDNEDDFNYTGSLEVPKPSGIVFLGENIVVGKGSLLVKRNKKLNCYFNDKATLVFEYPSEASLLEDPLNCSASTTINHSSSNDCQPINSSDESTSSSASSVIQTGSSLKNNTVLGGTFSGGLASYKPTFLAAESASFQLGVSRVVKSEDKSSKGITDDNTSADKDETEEELVYNMIKPAEPSETTSWSTSSTALDLLF